MLYARVTAKTFWGIGVALRALEQQPPAEILENRRISAKIQPRRAGAEDLVLKFFRFFTLEIYPRDRPEIFMRVSLHTLDCEKNYCAHLAMFFHIEIDQDKKKASKIYKI